MPGAKRGDPATDHATVAKLAARSLHLECARNGLPGGQDVERFERVVVKMSGPRRLAWLAPARASTTASARRASSPRCRGGAIDAPRTLMAAPAATANASPRTHLRCVTTSPSTM